MKTLVNLLLTTGVVFAATLNIGDQIATVKDSITAGHYQDAAISLASLRRNIVPTNVIAKDFSALKAQATPALLIAALDEALAKSFADDHAGTVHALDRAQILAAVLDHGTAPAVRMTQQAAKVSQSAATSPTEEADPLLLFDAAQAAYQASDYASALQYAKRYLATNATLKTSQHQHWVRTILGLAYYQQGDEANALAELALSASVTGVGNSFVPVLTLAQALATRHPQQVSAYLDTVSARNPDWIHQKDLATWKAGLASGHTPDFGAAVFP